jgi:hypothetical protein
MNNYALVYFAGLVISFALFYLPPRWFASDLKELNASVAEHNEDVGPRLLAFAIASCYVAASFLWFIFWPLYIKDKVFE